MEIKFEKPTFNEFIQHFTNTDIEWKYFKFQLTMQPCDVFKKYCCTLNYILWWWLGAVWGIIILLILMVCDYDPESNGENIRSDFSRVCILILGKLSFMNLGFLIHKYR